METPPGAPLKEKLRIEMAKLREMKFRHKVEYIWDYYKLHIVITVVILLIIGGLISTRFQSPAPRTALLISWNMGAVLDEHLEGLTNVLNERILGETSDERIEIVSLLFIENDPTISMASTGRLVAMLTTGVIDVFILDSRQLLEYSINDFIQPMENILAEVKAKSPEAYGRIEENIVFAPFESGENNMTERIMGINISGSSLLSELWFVEQEIFFSTSATSENIENIVQALIAFFE